MRAISARGREKRVQSRSSGVHDGGSPSNAIEQSPGKRTPAAALVASSTVVSRLSSLGSTRIAVTPAVPVQCSTNPGDRSAGSASPRTSDSSTAIPAAARPRR